MFSDVTSGVVELDGTTAAGRHWPLFDTLRNGQIVIYRGLPEIFALGETLTARVATAAGPGAASGCSELLRTGRVKDLESLAAISRAVRCLRETRYVSGLFSDLVAGWNLPQPVLVDAGYVRIVVPDHYAAARTNHRLFDPIEFVPSRISGPNEPEGMFKPPDFWGRAHRDVDVRHSHFQFNFWFPLHDLDQQQTLLLFPDAYRREVPQYGKLSSPDDPQSWGFGRPLQVPLKFGDTLVFHSQQLHASPSQALTRNRLTAELRIAAGCIDDNAKTYRRVFWRIENFMAAAGEDSNALERARELTENPTEDWNLAHALASRTAQGLLLRLFPSARACFRAGFLRRAADELDEAFVLSALDWSRLLRRVAKLSPGEDLQLVLVRVLLRQHQNNHARQLLRSICARTNSYFWALEAGWLATQAQSTRLARLAFRKARRLARASNLAFDRFTPDMPAAASPELLVPPPDFAADIATFFLERLYRDGLPFEDDVDAFDHRVYFRQSDPTHVPPLPERTMRQSIRRVPAMLGALSPLDFFPRKRSAAPSGPQRRQTMEPRAATKSHRPDESPDLRFLPRLLRSIEGYDIVTYAGHFYGLPQSLGPVDLETADLTLLTGIMVRDSSAELEREILSKRRTENTPRLLQSIDGYNVVAFGGRVYGIPQAIGSVDLETAELSQLPGLLRGDSVADVLRQMSNDTAPAPGN